MERELACIRGLLEKQYGNDYDMSYAWLNPETGDKVLLSPLAIDEWTRAIVSGLYYFSLLPFSSTYSTVV